MAHITPPPIDQLPSASRLRRATAVAIALAAVLFVTIVLPAERAIDPTGIGNKLGLTEMGLIKEEFRAEAAVAEANALAQRITDSTMAADKAEVVARLASGMTADRTDTTTLTIQPASGAAVEFMLERKAWATFEWSSAPGALTFYVRGDSAGAPEWSFFQYEKIDGARSGTGVLVARFTGVHRYYWINAGDSVATITVISRGSYSNLRLNPPTARAP